MPDSEIIFISDIHDPQAAVFAGLTEKQLLNRRHPDKGIFIAESPNVISLALDAGCVPISILCAQRHIRGKAAELIARCGVPVITAQDNVLQALTGYALTRGILCAMRRPRMLTPDEVCQNAHRLAFLYDLTDASNVGAVFRSAAALGYDGILLSASCCDPLGRKSVRVSMGTVFRIPWCRMNANWPDALHQYGFTSAAMALTAKSLDMDDPMLESADKLALMLGSEGYGLPDDVIDLCDFTVRIPMASGVDSLNVAAAAAVAFWQTRRR